MGKPKKINLGRRRLYQEKVYRFVCKELGRRPGGIVLADGVGLGKTYEALASVATLLSKKQHGKIKKAKQFKVLIIVPPGLVTKWAEELDSFLKYLDNWKSPSSRGVVDTFNDVVILRRASDLCKRKREVRYGKGVMPSGIYVMNSNLLYREEKKKITAFHRTNWDAVIIDEAHHLNMKILEEILTSKKTATLLLTATPFQLSPQEMRELLAATYGGYGTDQNINAAFEGAANLYKYPDFIAYRKSLNNYFQTGKWEDARIAENNRSKVSENLRHRIVRNKKKDNRRYHLVNEIGKAVPLDSSPFSLDDCAIDKLFREKGIIEVDDQFAQSYLMIRSRISALTAQKKRPFTAVALRQLLSSWAQFKNSASGSFAMDVGASSGHPKVDALLRLLSNIVKDEIALSKEQGFIGKVLIFTTYVGAERSDDIPKGDKSYGTAKILSDKIRKEVNLLFSRPTKGMKATKELTRKKLLQTIDKYGIGLKDKDKDNLKQTIIKRFAGSRMATLLFHNNVLALQQEIGQLKRLLQRVDPMDEIGSKEDEEKKLRLIARREMRVRQILERYSTRRLVARYDGATKQAEKDRHVHGFNSPFAPLVMIASAAGQEGIDLQKYCRHVIHYDLEWNPAKLEQREGRVDRLGREVEGPVNVYFLICRSTYDERMFYVMINRQRWHRVLLANRSALSGTPDKSMETQASEATIKKLCLNLEPHS